jgi:dTDP-4-dehydrorhamnose reductase
VATGETSWHGYARFVIEWARQHGHAVKVASEAITALPTSAYPTAAKRPLNSRLSTAKLRSGFSLTLPAWELGVARMLNEVLG